MPNSKPTKSKGQKDLLDRFYTKPEIAKQCIDLFSHHLAPNHTIIEPAAGNGSFSLQIPNCIALDICPQHSSIQQHDWLDYDFTQLDRPLAVITNPPFGQQGSLAIKFFQKASQAADLIALILPLSFEKISIQNRLPLDFHLKDKLILPSNSFTFNGDDYPLSTVFQIWIKSKIKRKRIKVPTTSTFFEFVDKNNADLTVRRVGGAAGKASLDLSGAVSSNYFIKNLTGLNNFELVELINSLNFPESRLTVGAFSLTKGELVGVLEEGLK